MHILIGAVVGAAFALVTIAGAALLMGKRPTARSLLLGILGGAVAGAVCTATLGTSSLLAVGTGRQALAFTVGGASGGAVEQVTDNALEGRDLHHGVVKATGIGGAAGLISLGSLRGTRHVLTRVAPRLVASPGGGQTIATRLLTAPVPGTGGGVMRLLDEDGEEEDSEAEPDPPAVPQGKAGGMVATLGW